MNKNMAFSEIRNFSDIKKEVENSMEYLLMQFNSETLKLALSGLNDSNEEVEEKTLQFMHHIDQNMSATGSANGNRFHKIPTLIAGYTYLKYYKEQVENLSLDELSLLARYSPAGDPSFYEHAVDYFEKGTLAAIINKHPEYYHQDKYMCLVGKRLSENMSNEDAAEFIRTTSVEELEKEADEDYKKIIQEVGKIL